MESLRLAVCTKGNLSTRLTALLTLPKIDYLNCTHGAEKAGSSINISKTVMNSRMKFFSM
jgi:hypothetical protein